MSAGGHCHRSSGCWVKVDIHSNRGEPQGDVVRDEEGRGAVGDAEAVVDGCCVWLSSLEGQ